MPFPEAEKAARRGHVLQSGLAPGTRVSVQQQALSVFHRTAFAVAAATIMTDEPGIAARCDPADKSTIITLRNVLV